MLEMLVILSNYALTILAQVAPLAPEIKDAIAAEVQRAKPIVPYVPPLWTIALGLAGFVLSCLVAIKPIWWRLQRPKLRLRPDLIDGHSDPYDPYESLFVTLRLPVENVEASWIRHRQAAKKVEIHLESIRRMGGEYHPPRFLPIRIRWTHVGQPVCDWIAHGATRLLDLGQLRSEQLLDPTAPGTINMSVANERHLDMCLFFDTEVQARQDWALPPGCYELGLLISCEQYCERKKLGIEWSTLASDPGVTVGNAVRVWEA